MLYTYEFGGGRLYLFLFLVFYQKTNIFPWGYNKQCIAQAMQDKTIMEIVNF